MENRPGREMSKGEATVSEEAKSDRRMGREKGDKGQEERWRGDAGEQRQAGMRGRLSTSSLVFPADAATKFKILSLIFRQCCAGSSQRLAALPCHQHGVRGAVEHRSQGVA